MHKTLKKQLVELGLNDHEAGIYLVLTEQSPSGAATIAKRLGLSRSTVYTALERLQAKGFVGTSYKNEVKQFIAESPDVFEEMLEQEKVSLDKKMNQLDGIKAHLKMLRSDDALIPNIVFFEGQESLKKIYMSMLRDAPQDSTMFIIRDEFVWKDEWKFVFEKEWNDRVRRWRSEKNIKTKMLVNDSDEERSHESFYADRKHLEFRFLSKEHSVDRFVVYVLGDTVSILSMEQSNLVGIKMTNRHIAKNFEAMFQGLWIETK